jgi:hypothetical protein
MSVKNFFLIIKEYLTRTDIVKKINEALKKKGLDLLKSYFKSKDVKLWGESKTENFLLEVKNCTKQIILLRN